MLLSRKSRSDPDCYKVEVAATPKTIDANTEYIQISSADRVKLNQKEQTNIRHAITKKQHSLFDKMDLTSTDLKQLVGFQTNLVAGERHFAKYDLRQIFMVVEPDRDQDGNVLSTLKAGSTQRNLFQW
jgi:type II secretory pathway component PulC